MPTTTTFLTADPGDLSPWVRSIWYSTGELDLPRERVLPTATTELVVNLSAPMQLVDGIGPETIVGTSVTGLLTQPITLEHPEVHAAVGMRLTPTGLRVVLGVPAAVVRGLVVDLEDLLEDTVDELAERCADARTPKRCLSVVLAWVRGRVVRFAGTADAVAARAAARIDASHGDVSMADLQARSGYGATRFHQRFVDEFGVTPKQFARLVRFDTALDRLGDATSLSQLALSLGYSDQPHMNRDFRTLGETTPTEVLRARYPEGRTLAVE
jgi:methylphosphotriester-DNA--protein-cysteine methyltransferase